MKRRHPTASLNALDLLEESLHTLRTAPLAAWLAYYTGSAPFVLGVLFFWSDMSRGAFAEEHLVGGAVGLSVLFVWMKSWQAVFAARLRAHVSREVQPAWSFVRCARLAARQLAIQPGSLFLLPVALVIMLPFGWLFAFYQNATVLGARGDEPLRPFVKRAWHQAKFAQMQHHAGLSLLFLFALFVWVNIAIAVIGVPFLGKTLLGIETPFSLGLTSMVNTTFFAAICGLAYLVLDPLLKTTYVLRCFYGESRQSGEDLRVTLRASRLSTTAALLIAALLCVASATRAGAADPAPSPRGVDAVRLDHSIDQVLTQPEYTWRAPRPKRIPTAEEKEGASFLRKTATKIRDAIDAFDNWLKKLSRPNAPSMPGGFSLFSREGLICTLIVVVAVIIGLLLWLLWRIRIKRRAALAGTTVAAPPPNLADEGVTAGQLPEDGWLRLALDMMERGDLRLAMRAFHLASLAHLAERNLVTLAKFKSNRDYERELLRRSHALPELTGLFSQNVSAFDRVWYGLHAVNGELVQEFRVIVERIKSC